MVFPFTFTLNIPGLTNPFTFHKPHQTPIGTANGGNAVISHDSDLRRSRAALQKITSTRSRSRPSPSPSPTPLSRKRGWEPSFSEPSHSTATLASTAGYLDTPAKYRHTIPDEYHNIAMTDSIDQVYDPEEEMPPLKRRRGLAGSIISTAISAALIGSAVGFTVYRLWRDRGKEALPEPHKSQPQQPPPPPYQQGEWQPAAASVEAPPPTPVQASPRSVRKSRHLQVTSTSKRPIIYHRKSRSRTQVSPIPAPPTPYFPTPEPEFNFGYNQENQLEQTPLEDKIDWIGDKLSMLIEQGKRALGTEVVVMSDAKEDEVDDGSGGWEEEDNEQPQTLSRSGSKHTKRPRNFLPPPLTYDSNSSSFAPSSAPGSSSYITPRKTHSRGISYETGLGLGLDSGSRNGTFNASPSFMEDSSSWQSPEIRESMEKARSRYLERRTRG